MRPAPLDFDSLHGALRAAGEGTPFKALEVVETWTDLYSALWPQDIAKSGIVLGFAKAVEARSPLIAAMLSFDPPRPCRTTTPGQPPAGAAPSGS